jgi:hypothetical protein
MMDQTTQTKTKVYAPKADARRRAYRNRMKKHLMMLTVPPGSRSWFR